ncbi:MAG: VWA domain-containing protein [Syntrophobacteraceae bacterium]
MHNTINNQRGAIVVIFALALPLLIGFAALGIEVGEWYITQAELSKAVDAASLSAAANISNPYVSVTSLAQDFGMANFQPGYLDTPATGTGTVAFTAATSPGGILTVTGQTNALAFLARIFGIQYVAVSSGGAAQNNNVQIMLVLDRSGSMAGTPETDIQNAVKAFIAYYQDVQSTNQIGLVTFATSATVKYALNYNFYTPILNAVNAMQATGATNTEDAIAQAGANFPDQTQVPPASRIQQFIVFFTDGHPTAFRGTFETNGTKYDAVVCSTGNCDSNSDSLYPDMGYPTSETWYNTNTLSPSPTGDGLPGSTTKCKTGGRNPVGYSNTNWSSFASYPVPGLGAESFPAYCSISATTHLNGQNGYICQTARQMALDNVNLLKARFVQFYAIGYGSSVDSTFLAEVASGSNYLFITPDSSQLQSILSQIAKDIQLRLIQ